MFKYFKYKIKFIVNFNINFFIQCKSYRADNIVTLANNQF